MDIKEKLLALQVILEDIRGNWGYDLEERVDKAEELVDSIMKNEKYSEDMEYMKESINSFRDDMKEGYADGRSFRCEYPCGYENMDKIHGLSKTYQDKSDDFKKCVSCLTYPQNRFEDVE